jgi:hypothetical protein
MWSRSSRDSRRTIWSQSSTRLCLKTRISLATTNTYRSSKISSSMIRNTGMTTNQQFRLTELVVVSIFSNKGRFLTPKSPLKNYLHHLKEKFTQFLTPLNQAIQFLTPLNQASPECKWLQFLRSIVKNYLRQLSKRNKARGKFWCKQGGRKLRRPIKCWIMWKIVCWHCKNNCWKKTKILFSSETMRSRCQLSLWKEWTQVSLD